MKPILIVTRESDRFSRLAQRLQSTNQFTVRWADSKDALMAEVAAGPPGLTIIDETLDDRTGIAIARDVIMKNAMANIALVSELSEAGFHEASEGLGVVAQLPASPDEGDADRLADILASLP